MSSLERKMETLNHTVTLLTDWMTDDDDVEDDEVDMENKVILHTLDEVFESVLQLKNQMKLVLSIKEGDLQQQTRKNDLTKTKR